MLRPYLVVGCLHLGNRDTDMKLAYAYRDWAIKYAKGVFLLGDNFDACIPCWKPDTMWAQKETPQQQYELGLEYYEPLRGKIILGCTSNHSERIWRTTSIELDKNLARELDYGGWTPKVKAIRKAEGRKDGFTDVGGQRTVQCGKISYKVTIAHGQSGGERNMWGDAQKMLAIYPDSDIIALSHRHRNDQTIHEQLIRDKRRRVQFLRTGTMLNICRYGKQAMYSPSPKGFAILYLDDEVRRVKVDTSCEVPKGPCSYV